jgi:hypothetical protein
MAYVYRHIRLDTNEIFYIGIGSENNDYKRAYTKRNRNKHWRNIVNKTDYEVEIVLDNLTWDEACTKEIEFIKLYGRKDLNEGTLCNLTDGGEGPLGFVHSQESREKLSKSKIGKPTPTKGKPGTNLGKKFSEETKQRMSESHIGKKHALGSKRTNEAKQKYSESKLGDKNPMYGKDPWNKGITHQVTCPHCNKTGDKVVMSRWHFDKCKNLKK